PRQSSWRRTREGHGASRGAPLGVTSRIQRPANSRCDFRVRRKSVEILLRHDLFTDPHGELATSANNEFGLDSGLVLDERGHTGRAGQVVSRLAVTNADALHVIVLHGADDWICSATHDRSRSYDGNPERNTPQRAQRIPHVHRETLSRGSDAASRG